MTKDSNCLFCKIVAGEIPCIKLYEDERVLSFMDINPYNDGHCLVICKSHATGIYDISNADLSAVALAAKKVATAVDTALSPHGMNLVQANGPGAGQSVFHFHIHVFPRQRSDNAAMNWHQEPGDMERIKANAERILRELG